MLYILGLGGAGSRQITQDWIILSLVLFKVTKGPLPASPVAGSNVFKLMSFRIQPGIIASPPSFSPQLGFLYFSPYRDAQEVLGHYYRSSLTFLLLGETFLKWALPHFTICLATVVK